MPLNRRVKAVNLKSRYVDKVLISALVKEVDLVINVLVFKTHIMTGITRAIKHTYGYVAGAYKSKLHLRALTGRRFAALVCDIFSIRPPDFHIVDALTVMEGNGPSHGSARPLGKIIAGADAVAVDATLARMAGFNPADLHMPRIAEQRGYGTMNRKRIEYTGAAPEPIPGFQLPVTYLPRDKAQKKDRTPSRSLPGTELIMRWSFLKPHLARPEKCDRCGECAANCPPRAIKPAPHPVIGRRCIACFCCVELCPGGALEVDLK